MAHNHEIACANHASATTAKADICRTSGGSLGRRKTSPGLDIRTQRAAVFCGSLCYLQFMLTTEQIKELIRTGHTAEFYHDKAWEKLSKRIRKEQTECWFCKQHGKVGPADLVHHRYELKQYPEYAYSRYYTDALGNKHINLVAVCFACHEEQHGRGYAAERKHYTNAERW